MSRSEKFDAEVRRYWPLVKRLNAKYLRSGRKLSRERLQEELSISGSLARVLHAGIKYLDVFQGGAGHAKTHRDRSNSPVLVFSDVHAPYHHKKALEFLTTVYHEKQCGSVVCAGDLFDYHAMSRFVSEPDAMSPEEEYRKAKEFAKELVRILPKGVLVEGNHDSIPVRQLKTLGMTASLLKSKEELYGLGPGWQIKSLYHTVMDGRVLIEHGIGSCGMYGAINTAVAKRSSYCQGHTHSFAMVAYRSNYKDTIFGMNTGCLFDSNSLAARYGQHAKWKGVLGCGVVYAPDYAEFIPMR